MKKRNGKYFGKMSASSYGVVWTGLIVVLIGVALLISSLIQQIHNAEDSEGASVSSITGSSVVDAVRDEDELGGAEKQAYSRMKKVLFISSYDPTAAYYQDQINGVLSVSAQDGIEFDVLNMDTYKHHSDEDMKMCVERARQMMAETSYQGIITADDAALQFVRAEREELFSGLPVVFFGVNDHDAGIKAAEDPLITGYLEPNNIEHVLKMAINLLDHPDKAVFIVDDSETSQAVEERITQLSLSQKYSSIDFEMLDFGGMTIQELEDQLSTYDSGTFIVFVSAFEDREGNYYTATEMSRLICSAAHVPVFRNSKGGYGNGVCGGRTVNMRATAAKAVSLMAQVLDEGMDLSTISAMQDEEGQYVASYDVMKKYGLSLNDLPKDTLIIGKPQTFNEKYGQIFYPMIIIIAGMFLIALGFSMENSARTKTAEQLEFAMRHDALTGLLNRQAALQQMGQDSRLKKDGYSIILLDLDDFQEINETYGHDNGDTILRSLSLELQAIGRRMNASICRYGGDEFLIVFYGRTLREQDEAVTAVLQVFRRERKVGFDTICPYCSAGIVNSCEGVSVSELILQADLALNQSKRKGKNLATLYTPDLSEAEIQREETKNSVLDAIEHDGLYMLYQPQVCTATGKLIGFEALVRMKDKDIGPGVFIPLAEENGWIREIGRRTTAMTIQQIADWRREGLTPPPVSLNYSAGQLSDTGYISFLVSLLKQYHLPADCVKLEITERLAMSDNEEIRQFYHQVKEAGLSLHMDDFGTGYSSFAALSYVPVDTVKIDKSLVDAYLTQSCADVFRNIVDMVHALHKSIIVEGVEREEQYDMLKKFRADSIQGYYFGRPLSSSDAAEDIRKGSLLSERKHL